MEEPILLLSLHNRGIPTSGFLKLKNQFATIIIVVILVFITFASLLILLPIVKLWNYYM